MILTLQTPGFEHIVVRKNRKIIPNLIKFDTDAREATTVVTNMKGDKAGYKTEIIKNFSIHFNHSDKAKKIIIQEMFPGAVFDES